MCRVRSAPRGSRSASTRALIRRISVTVRGGRGPRPGSASGRSSRRTAGRGRRRPPPGRPEQRLGLPGLRPARVVLPVGVERAHERAVAGPPGAGRRRPPGPGPGSRSRGGGGRSRPRSWRTWRRPDLVGAAERLADEQHVRVAAVAQLGRRRAGPCRSRRAARAGGVGPPSARCTDSSVAAQHRRPTPTRARRTPPRRTACRAGPRTRRAAARGDAASGPWPRRRRGRTGARRSCAATRRRSPGRGCSSSGWPATGAASSRSTSGARTSRSGTSAEVPSSRMSRSRDQPLVAQQPQVPRGAGQRLGHPAVGQQPAVGVGGAGELVEQHRQQRLLDRGRPRHPAGQRPQVVQRALGRRPAQRAEPDGRRPPPRAARFGGQPRHRVEQRPVEQLLVQAPDAAGVAPPLLDQDADDVVPPVGPQLRRPGEPAQRVRVVRGGQQVGAAQRCSCSRCSSSAGSGRRRRGSPRRRARRTRGSRGLAARRASSGSASAASARPCTSWSSWTANSTSRSPPRPSLSSRSAWSGRTFSSTRRRMACTSRDEVGPARGAPHHRRDGLGVGLAQVGVARDRARLEQRLELPGLGPPLVVGHVSVERADQRALPALGTQVRVDREAGLPRDAHHPGGQPGGPLVRGFGDEHDVDVADVVQLRATRLAHGDDSEPARLAVGLRERDGERRPQGRGGQVGELRGDVLERQDRQRRLADGGEVGGGEGEHLVAVGGAQGVHGRRCRATTRRRRPARLPAGRRGPRRRPSATSRCGWRRRCTRRGRPRSAGASGRDGRRGGRRARSSRRAGRTAARGARRHRAARRRRPSTRARSRRRAGPAPAARGRGRGCGPGPT